MQINWQCWILNLLTVFKFTYCKIKLVAVEPLFRLSIFDPLDLCSLLCTIRGHQHWNQVCPRGGRPGRGRHWIWHHQKWQWHLHRQVHSPGCRPVYHHGAVCRAGKNTVFIESKTDEFCKRVFWIVFTLMSLIRIDFWFAFIRKFPSVHSKWKWILPMMPVRWGPRALDSTRQVRSVNNNTKLYRHYNILM